jgi:predicted ATPase
MERAAPLLVGRENEVAMLMKRFASGRERDGRAGLIAGETGVGKLRLLRALRENVPKLTRRRPHWISRASK